MSAPVVPQKRFTDIGMEDAVLTPGTLDGATVEAARRVVAGRARDAVDAGWLLGALGLGEVAQ